MQRPCGRKDFHVIKKLSVKRLCDGTCELGLKTPNVLINNAKSQQCNIIKMHFLLLSNAGQVALVGASPPSDDSGIQTFFHWVVLPFQYLSYPREKKDHTGNVSIASRAYPSYSHSIAENCSFVSNLAMSVKEK